MTTLREAAHISIPGLPQEDDYKRDAFFCWKRAHSVITDLNRKSPGMCRQLTLDGMPGWLWWGQVASLRRYLWAPGQPKAAPYTPDGTCDAETASNNFRKVHHHLTRMTGSMICIEDHRGADSLWWVADTWGDKISDERFEELKLMAQGSSPRQSAPPAGPPPMPGFTSLPAQSPQAEPVVVAPAPVIPDSTQPTAAATLALPCRYRLATGCTAEYSSRASLYSHEELSASHATQRSPLLDCPLCSDAIGSAQGRSNHLSVTHGIKAHTRERQELDAQQTKDQLEAAARRKATLAANADTQEARLRRPAPDTDPDVQAAIDARARKATEAPVAPATPPVSLAEDPRIAGLRALIDEYDQLVKERDELRREKDDREAKIALAKEALGL